MLQLSGSITTESRYDYLSVYDGSDNNGTKLLDAVSSTSSGTQTAVGPVVTTGQSMTLYFNSDLSSNYAGLDLTVTLISTDTESGITVNDAMGGTVAASVEGSFATTAKVSKEVTLTATPSEGYVLSGISVKDANNNAVAVTWNVWTNTATFTMPASAVTVTPTFTNELSNLSVNMPKTGTKSATIPEGVTSFKVYDDGGAGGNYSNYCDGTLTLTAPTGYALRLSGNITTDYNFDYLTVYDGSTTSGTKLLNGVSSTSNGTQTAITTVESTSESMTLYFHSDFSSNYAGLDLTVKIFILWSGSGTEEAPYIIEFPNQLDLLAHRVNGTHGETANDYSGTYFKLGADITYDYSTLGSTESNYEAIGDNSHAFAGHFDGDGHTISGIRIYKGGEDETTFTDDYQGLFGNISSTAEVKNVILADATITGYKRIGGIVGYNNQSTVTNCYYTSTDIHGKGGSNNTLDNDDSTVGNNYNGTVSNSGLAHKVTLGTGVTLGNAATGHGPLTIYGSVVAMGYNDGTSTTIYSTEGSVITLGYTVPDGYTFSGFTATAGTIGGNATDGYTLTMPAADVTVSATFTKTPITTSYVDEDGTLHENVSAIPLDNTMTNLPGGWYVVNSDVNLTTKLNFTGDTHLILADGKTLSIDASGDSGESGCYFGLSCKEGTIGNGATYHDLTIYGQAAGTGKVSANHGHPGYATSYAYYAKNITINGGVVEATNTGNGISGSNITINGGQILLPNYAEIRAGNSIVLGWRKPSDFIQAYRFVNPGGSTTIQIADGKVFTDGTNVYDNTTTTSTLEHLSNVTLRPCLVLADNASNADAIAAYNGKTIAVALDGRTLTKDGNWNTLCLPFDIADPAAVFGTGVKVKTLSGYTNNGTTVTVTLTDAATIEAGTPYIIMLPDNAVDMENPVFTGVTIDNTMHDVTAGDATFKGTYSPVALTANDKKKLFLADNMLWYPNAAVTVRACRAYFELVADVPELSNGAPSIVVDFGDGNSTGVALLLSPEGDENGASTRGGLEGASWYTLDGRKLSQKPSAKGLYIINGKKVVVK